MKGARYVITSQAPILRGIIDNVFVQHGLERRAMLEKLVERTYDPPAICEVGP